MRGHLPPGFFAITTSGSVTSRAVAGAPSDITTMVGCPDILKVTREALPDVKATYCVPPTA